jgi:gas vesicle protein
MSKNSKIFLALLAGTAAGLVVGLLFAPDKGTESRKKIADTAKKLADTVIDKAEETIDRMTSAVKKN